ncbi:putative G-box-binding factor [Helianthus annuus]|nr:putative G-box-binding factor [Helianthus annuus]
MALGLLHLSLRQLLLLQLLIHMHGVVRLLALCSPTTEMESKAPNGKDKVNKKSKGSSGNVNASGAKTGESGKAASSSGNDGGTQSAESGNNGSSDASDEDNSRIILRQKGKLHQMLADGDSTHLFFSFTSMFENYHKLINAANRTKQQFWTQMFRCQCWKSRSFYACCTNLNMGMDLWNPSAGSGL